MVRQRPACTGTVLDELARMARLDLPPERKSVVGPTVDLVHGVMDPLDTAELVYGVVGEPNTGQLTDIPAPAAAFDPRWE